MDGYVAYVKYGGTKFPCPDWRALDPLTWSGIYTGLPFNSMDASLTFGSGMG